MPGSIFTLFTPFTRNSVLFGLFDYVVPITLYCVWSALAFLDLARAGDSDRGRVWRWSAVILLLPLFGAGAYLLAGRTTVSRTTRLAAVTGGLVVMLAAFGLTWIRIR